SRRRHTRFSRDWSSDVCSSDLFAMVMTSGLWGKWKNDQCNDYIFLLRRSSSEPADSTASEAMPGSGTRIPSTISRGPGLAMPDRSEERRVGKAVGARREPQNGG